MEQYLNADLQCELKRLQDMNAALERQNIIELIQDNNRLRQLNAEMLNFIREFARSCELPETDRLPPRVLYGIANEILARAKAEERDGGT